MDTPTAVGSAATVLGDRYVLGAIAGQGGMSTVYRAVDTRTSKQVAVKVFHPGVELADSLERRRREVEVASALHHHSIVEVFDADVERSNWAGERAYIVTELVNGPTLSHRLRRQRLTDLQVIGMGAVLCDALAYMHDQNIVHRDIKPANILLAGEDEGDWLQPKLTDFGLSFMVDSTRMTRMGLTAGTPTYLSPEQVRGRAITPASDVYSLGLVLIEALTGQPAFTGHGIEAAVARLTSNPLLPANIDPRLTNLLLAMTAANPDDRPTAAVVRDQLSALEGGGSLMSQLVATRPDPTLLAPTARWRRFSLAAGTLTLLCAGAVAAVVIVLASYLNGSSTVSTPFPGVAVAVPSTSVSSSAALPASSASSISPSAVSTPVGATRPVVLSPAPTTGIRLVGRSAASGGDGHGKKPGKGKPKP